MLLVVPAKASVPEQNPVSLIAVRRAQDCQSLWSKLASATAATGGR